MKNKQLFFVITLILLIMFSSCVSKKRAAINCRKNDLISNMPVINDETETFDTSLFQKKPPNKISTDKGLIIECFEDDEYWKMYESKHIMIVDYHFPKVKNNRTIFGRDNTINPFFGIYKEFSDKGVIQVKGLISYYGFKLGLWYYYDKSGKLIKTVDQDAGYKFGVSDIIYYCLKNSIPIEEKLIEKRVEDVSRVVIWKIRLKNGHPAWLLIYPIGSDDKSVYIDAKNGRVIETKETPAPIY